MPLLSGNSDAVIRENIRREIHHGKKRKQAIAIAYSVAGRGKKKKQPSDDHSNWMKGY